jgi:hypothetical protein
MSLQASGTPGAPKCGGDPRYYDPSDSRWFIYEKKPLSFEAQGRIISYGLKSCSFNELRQFDVDCLDIENVHIAAF